MHGYLKVLLEELKLIRDNSNGGLKRDSGITLHHGEVISSIRAFVRAFIDPNFGVEHIQDDVFAGWEELERDKVFYYLDLIRTRGLPHCDRSRAAKKCVEVIEARILLEEEEEKKKRIHRANTEGDTQSSGNEDWDEIPF